MAPPPAAVPPVPAAVPPGFYSTPLPSYSPAVDASVLPAPPPPPVVLTSSSDAKFSVSSPLHSAISSAISSGPLPPTRYIPYAPLSLLLASVFSVVRILLISAVDVVSVASVSPCSAPAVLRVVPCRSLDLPPSPTSALPWSLASPHAAPPPLSLADNIDCKDKDVSNRTGRGEAHWLDAGRSAPRGKCPNRTVAVAGDSISRNFFLHRPQQ